MHHTHFYLQDEVTQHLPPAETPELSEYREDISEGYREENNAPEELAGRYIVEKCTEILAAEEGKEHTHIGMEAYAHLSREFMETQQLKHISL